MTATMRDDLLFNDGVPVTAEDAKFTVDYITEQGVNGAVVLELYRDDSVLGSVQVCVAVGRRGFLRPCTGTDSTVPSPTRPPR